MMGFLHNIVYSQPVVQQKYQLLYQMILLFFVNPLTVVWEVLKNLEQCFLDKQLQLFPEAVAETLDEAEDFLEECMAVVVDSVEDVIEYFDEAGMDVDGAVDDEILEADEVFDIGDGRYLIVEA